MVRHLRGTGSDAMASAPVAAAGLSKSFELRRGETVPVLRHVDFTAGWGQMTGIVGPSGSGKSTLMYCLAGLESVSDGSVRVLGQEVTRMSRPSRRGSGVIIWGLCSSRIIWCLR